MEYIDNDHELYNEISFMIEQTRTAIYGSINKATVSLFWNIGHYINDDTLRGKRADYGKQIVSALPTQLSWSHIVEVLPLKSVEAKLYYLNE
jgi:hypothetical protein